MRRGFLVAAAMALLLASSGLAQALDPGLDDALTIYRRGGYARTRFECEADARRVVVRIGEPTGDRSVVPPGRRYLVRLGLDAPREVTAEGHGALARRIRSPDRS